MKKIMFGLIGLLLLATVLFLKSLNSDRPPTPQNSSQHDILTDDNHLKQQLDEQAAELDDLENQTFQILDYYLDMPIDNNRLLNIKKAHVVGNKIRLLKNACLNARELYQKNQASDAEKILESNEKTLYHLRADIDFLIIDLENERPAETEPEDE